MEWRSTPSRATTAETARILWESNTSSDKPVVAEPGLQPPFAMVTGRQLAAFVARIVDTTIRMTKIMSAAGFDSALALVPRREYEPALPSPFTVPEVKTLMDGITVGRRRIEDAEQVLIQARSCRDLIARAEHGTFRPDRPTIEELQAHFARGSARATESADISRHSEQGRNVGFLSIRHPCEHMRGHARRLNFLACAFLIPPDADCV